MYQELPINKDLTAFVQAELVKSVNKLKENTKATDYEISLALKNLVSEHENYMTVRAQSAALAKALNSVGK